MSSSVLKEMSACFLGFILGICLGSQIVLVVYNQDLIKRGYKEYDTKTGNLQWVDND